MDIEFKTIPMFGEHSISECGKFIKNKHSRIIVQGKQVIKGKETGYIYATMLASDYSYNKRVAVHRLVAFTWLAPPPTPKHVWINHKDGNKANNHANNLEWSTISQNIQHAYDTGLKVAKQGKEHHLYGKKSSIKTKALQSASKLGVNHPKFKGYYFANFKKFESATQAAKYLNTNSHTIIRRCNNPKFKKDGFYFLPIE